MKTHAAQGSSQQFPNWAAAHAWGWRADIWWARRRNIAHAREQQLAGWETAVAQLRKREQRLLDELDWREAEALGQQARPPGPAGAAERVHGLSSLWR